MLHRLIPGWSSSTSRYPLAGAFDRIALDQARMGGLPSIRGLRIPVATVIGQRAAGRSYDEVLEDFPELDREDILAALEYAAVAVQERELPLRAPA